MALPTQKTPPKSSLSDLTVLAYGRNKIGKCLAGNTLVIDPANGGPVTIRQMVEGRSGDVLTMKEAGRLRTQTPSHYLQNEPAQLYRLKTQTGREIEATANHPFLTREGWKPLGELTPGLDRVAVVAEYPKIDGYCKTSREMIKVLAYLLADGNLEGSPTFTKTDPEVRLDFEEAVEAGGDECSEYIDAGGIPLVRVRGRAKKPNNVLQFLKEVGLSGLRSRDKFIPDFVFTLRRDKLAIFLSRLFTCDGSVEAQGKISYSSTSVRMVRQVQHLLLRFGIVSLSRDRFLKGELYGAELYICAKNDLLRFIDEIGFIGEKAIRAEALRASLYHMRAAATQLDRQGAILFDRIVSIEPTTVEPVYDLTVEGSHNFVAADFIVHNSTFCSHAEGALFLATEPGLNHLDVYQTPIATWDELLAVAAEIAEGKHPFKTIIIDTVDNAYRMCSEHILRKAKAEHESDMPYGKGYALINNEFYRVLNKLALLPSGLWLVSHAQEKEVDTARGKILRTMPTLPDKARKIVLGMVDMILYCDIEMVTAEGGQPQARRVIRTKPTLIYEAGDRTGRLPELLDLDYGKFIEAFQQGSGTGVARPAKALPAAPAAK